MRIKAAVQMLRDKGYEAANVMEQGMGGYKDPLLWSDQVPFRRP